MEKSLPASEISEVFARMVANLRPATDEEEARWFFEDVICTHLKAGNLPDRFWQEIVTWPVLHQRMAYQATADLIKGKGAVVALVGKRGAGKTTIAAQIMIHLIREWHKWSYTPKAERTGERPVGLGEYRKTIEVVAKLKPLYSDQGTISHNELTNYRDGISKVSVLILDEKHDADELVVSGRVLTDLIDLRYAQRKDTIIISNQEQDEFERTTNPSILSRLTEHGIIIPCKWPSFRVNKPSN